MNIYFLKILNFIDKLFPYTYGPFDIKKGELLISGIITMNWTSSNHALIIYGIMICNNIFYFDEE